MEEFQTEREPDCRIPYIEQMSEEGRRGLSEILNLLLNQTYLLERKYDKRTGTFRFSPEYRLCSRHLEFIRSYFSVMGIEIAEHPRLGLIYARGGALGETRLSRLATLYLLVLKLIYDEEMENVSSSIHVYTTLGAIHDKLATYRLFKRPPSPTEIRRALSMLRRFQILEPLDLLDDLDSASPMIIYPSINVVLMGDDIRALLEAFDRSESANPAEETPGSEPEEVTEEDE